MGEKKNSNDSLRIDWNVSSSQNVFQKKRPVDSRGGFSDRQRGLEARPTFSPHETAHLSFVRLTDCFKSYTVYSMYSKMMHINLHREKAHHFGIHLWSAKDWSIELNAWRGFQERLFYADYLCCCCFSSWNMDKNDPTPFLLSLEMITIHLQQILSQSNTKY